MSPARRLPAPLPRRLGKLAPRLLVALLWLAAAAGSAAAPPAPAPGPTTAADDLPAQPFRRAEGTRVWQFPRDHGQHPAYRLEWWYYTGIVRSEDGRTFGFQVTFFRQGVTAAESARPSAWAVRSLYLAHAALSDLSARRYLHARRAGRDSLALSGAAPDVQRIWLQGWRADPLADDPHGVRLQVQAPDFALALALRARPGGKGPVLHGQDGLDRKGAEPGQASWYYSLPRLATTGTVRLGQNELRVSGTSWMDHEFGTGQLAPELAGWDWLALRLEDGSDLMLYRLRRRDGSATEFSGGSLIAPDGARRALTLADAGPGRAEMTPGRIWRSPASGGAYPLEWDVAVPEAGLALHVSSAFDAQEQPPAAGSPFAYWEGVVGARGIRDGRPIRGEGYLELTGYAGELGGALR